MAGCLRIAGDQEGRLSVLVPGREMLGIVARPGSRAYIKPAHRGLVGNERPRWVRRNALECSSPWIRMNGGIRFARSEQELRFYENLQKSMATTHLLGEPVTRC